MQHRKIVTVLISLCLETVEKKQQKNKTAKSGATLYQFMEGHKISGGLY